MKSFLRIIVLLAVVISVGRSQYYYDYLRIQHPQQTWRYGTATVEQTLLSVKQKGLSYECGFYLTISGRGLGFTSADSVEIQLDFGLPNNAVVNDLWLWMDDNTIMKGVLLDRWTASSIYESIVKRRKDPALLMKYAANRYTLRIYPMIGDKSRKVKITYLVPMTPMKGLMTAPIPTSVPRLSANPVKMTVLYWPEQTLIPAKFGEFDGGFETKARIDTATQRPYYYGEIPPARIAADVTLQTTAEFTGAVMLKKFQPKSLSAEGYYQLAFTPSAVFDINTSIKSAFMFEMDETKMPSSTLSYLTAVKSLIRNNYTAKDSFNLIFSSDKITRIRQSGWYGGDSASVESAFNKVTISMLQTGNNLTGLITDGLSFIKEQGGTGFLWLVAGTDKLGSAEAGNTALTKIITLNTTKTPIYILDNLNWNTTYNYFNNKYYYGNDYLYENIAKMTGSLFFTTGRSYGSMFTQQLNDVLVDARGKITSFDVLTRLENGFCANRLTNVSLTGGELPLSVTVNQVGKFIGQFPFVLEVAGIYKGTTITKKITVTDSPDLASDSLIGTVWAGRQIAAMEDMPVTNTLTKSIVDMSLQYGVLSRYTALLALEPNDTLRPCSGCKDETKLLSVTTPKPPIIPSTDSLLQAYPNPFNGSTVLKIRLPKGVLAKDARFQIFNMLGQLVRTFDASQFAADTYSTVTWNGVDDRGVPVASGMYVAVLMTTARAHSLKLMYLK
ncbi:MAG TPA: VIT domain-containing protein [Bacteroidota bacterium]|nr:VIT domain-containing protein [Bacteroidota bacterium]